MNPEIVALWFSGASLLLQAVSMIPKDPRKRTPEDEAALMATAEAYYSTQAYYALPDDKRSGGLEWDMAAKWERAAILLKKYDSSLYDRLNAKSEYWRRGGTWSDDAIQAAGIGLESIKKAVEERIKK